MKCAKAQIKLQGYVDGELSPCELKSVRRHLDRCAACAAELARLSDLKTLLSENRSEAPAMDTAPEFFWSQVSARIKGETKPRLVLTERFDFDWRWVLGWASTCIAIAAFAAFLWMKTWATQQPLVVGSARQVPGPAQVDQIVTAGPELYAGAYHSKESRATIIWTEGMPVISLEL